MGKHDGRTPVEVWCLMILCVIAVAASLYWLKPVVVPLALAIFVAIILRPVVGFLEKNLRLPYSIASIVTVLLLCLLLGMAGGLIVGSVSGLSSNAEAYSMEIEKLVNNPHIITLLKRLGLKPAEGIDFLSIIPLGSLTGVITTTTSSVTSLVSQGFMVMLFVVFLLLGLRDFEGPETGVPAKIEAGVRQYVGVKVFVSALVGFAIFVIFKLLSVPFALSFATIAFLFNFIPVIGSVVATLLPLPMLLFTPGMSAGTILLALALPTIAQNVVGNVIEPKMMGSSLDLSPVTVLLALSFWGMLWGLEGMILAIPIVTVIKIVLEKSSLGMPLVHLMTGNLGALMSSDHSATETTFEGKSMP